MEDLHITKTKYTLEVHSDLEAGTLEMISSSYPENSFEFFKPIYSWVDFYHSEKKSLLTLNLKLEYLNTSSSKCILDLLEIFENHYQQGSQIKVNWYYSEEDEDMLETGEEFREDFEMPFEIIAF